MLLGSNSNKTVKETSPINTLGDQQALNNYQQYDLGMISFITIKVTNWLMLNLQ
jgi:hypothetical protein